MSVNEVQQLDFGDYDGTAGGTITVSATGGMLAVGPVVVNGTWRTGTYTITVPTISPVTGCDSYPIRIRYRRNNNAALSGAGTDMPIGTFTSDLASEAFTLVNGQATVNIGGQLTSGGTQAAGPYTGNYNIEFTFRR